MDLQLIAYWLFELSTYHWVIDPAAWLVILKVAVGLGMVIFVHELGHFAVAKLCGVQCDKFYLGFDIGGWKLCKFKWGETEYGIGILPLGGYVKMLGQEDNPARLKEELERAKAAQSLAAANGKSNGAAGVINETTGEPLDIAAAEQALFNPRSYLAQSVPRRMAIISAGVIMNIIFAFIFAVAAYYMGVNQLACEVGQVQPGSPAWQAGLQTGDAIVSIAGKKAHSFSDLLSGVTLGDSDKGVELVVRRQGERGEKTIVVEPSMASGLFPTIGVTSSFTTTLLDKPKNGLSPTVPGSAANRAEPTFAPDDKIVRIGERQIESYADVRRESFLHAGETLKVMVERPLDELPDGTSQSTNTLIIDVPPQPIKSFGLQMAMGPVLDVQSGSPAAKAGINPGDVLMKIDGQPVGDPMTLGSRLLKLQAKKIALELDRNGQIVTVEVDVPEAADFDVEPIRPGGAIGLSGLGIAYNVLSTVVEVEKDSPAAREGMKPGDVIVEARIVLPDDETLKELGYYGIIDKSAAVQPIEFSAEEPNWPYFFYRAVQNLPQETKVEFKLAGGGKKTLEFQAAKDWFNSERGFMFNPLTILRRAESFSDAVSLGAVETLDSASKVFVFIKKLSDGQISPRALGGPVAIAQKAGQEASRGTAELLLFLTLLSANLAVINFLPIPVLDGGHMVFLAWEGIRGKPADERIQLLLSYIGLILLLSLMIFVLGLDFNLISRN